MSMVPRGQPDQVCQECAQSVSKDQPYIAARRLVFHQKCFVCHRCNKKMTLTQWTKSITNKLICVECDQNAKALHMHIAARPPTPYVCVRCNKQLNHQVFNASDDGIFCATCFHCYNCLKPINDLHCFVLLDVVYCLLCEDAYKRRKDLIRMMGSGPPGILSLKLSDMDMKKICGL